VCLCEVVRVAEWFVAGDCWSVFVVRVWVDVG